MQIPVHIKWKINHFGNIHIQGTKKNIYIFTTAKSGSTWLMEMIATQRGIKYINEPFLVRNYNARFRPLPADLNFLLPNPDRRRLIANYFKELSHNKIPGQSLSILSKFHNLFTNRIVFKIQRCKDLMPWFEEELRAQIVYLVRHPLAVAVTQQRYDRLPLFLANDRFCERYLTPELKEYGWSIVRDGSELEKKVLNWSLQNLPPMNFFDRTNWVCLTYEDLVTKPRAMVEMLAKKLELPDPEKMFRQASIPCSSSHSSDKETKSYLRQSSDADNRTVLLRKWRKKVTEQEELHAFKILERFGIDLYQAGNNFPMPGFFESGKQ